MRTPPLPPTVWALVAARTANRLGAFTLPFLTVALVRSYDASVTTAGMLVAAFGLATLPSRLAGGRLSDLVGPRATIVGGLVATALAQLALAAAPTLALAATAVVALGLAFEVHEPPGQALVAEVTPPAQHPQAYGVLNASTATAGAAGGLLAAWLAGVDLRWLFVVDAGTCLLAAALVAAAVRAPRRPRTLTRGPILVRDDRRLLRLTALGAGVAAAYLQSGIALPLTLAARGVPPSHLGLLLTVAALTVVGAQPLLVRARPVAALGHRAATALGLAVMAAGAAGYATAHDPSAFVAATVVWSVGDALVFARVYARVAALAPPGRSGSYLATYGLSWGVAGVAAPLVGTGLVSALDPTATWLVLAAGCAALAARQAAGRGAAGDPVAPVAGSVSGGRLSGPAAPPPPPRAAPPG